MDFFAGSGTLGEAIYKVNSQGGNRRFILVQLPEEVLRDRESSSHNAGTVSNLATRRLANAARKIKSENTLTASTFDSGFRAFKIDTSNMQEVYYTPDQVQQTDLHGHVDNIRADRTSEDLLFQVLLDWGVDLASPISAETVDGKTVFFVDGNVLAACFDAGVTDELVKQIAQRKPLRAVFRDASYGSDSVKINVDQIFRFYSPETEVKAI